MTSKLSSLFSLRGRQAGESWTDYYQAHELQFGIAFFLGGFLFDVFTLADVDDPVSLAQQWVYLMLIGWALYYEILESTATWKPGRWSAKLWGSRELLLHFLLGSLLSLYSLFYLKSASLATSFGFILFLVVLLVANELPMLQSRGPLVRLSIWTLCLSSFFVCLFPVVLGFGGVIPFALALLSAGLVLLGFLKFLAKQHPEHVKKARSLFLPSAGVLAIYALAYVLKLVPPVPLALKDIGIYRKVEKTNGEFILTENRPWWRFWHRGDQYFDAKPGEPVYVYAAIAAPGGFSERVRMHWLYKDRTGWKTSDQIPMNITGGRREGFRGFSFKSNLAAGEWRVQIETADGREIGRIGFDYVPLRAD